PVGKIFDLSGYKHKSQYELSYLFSAAKNEDQAIETPSYDYTKINYGGIVYSKTAIVLDYLMAYLGEKEMDKAMQAYFDEWHFKHPLPEDFRRSIEKTTGKNLSWLFDGLINSTKKLDYKITFVRKNQDGSWDIGVKNNGDINGPVFIQGMRDGKLIGEVIYDGFDGKQALTFPISDIDYFKIDANQDMPEINRNNNRIRTKGIFKKTEHLKLQFLGSLDNPDKSQLFWTPVPAWNNYNKWMFGIAFYNNVLPQKKFEFELMPLYSVSTKDIAGYGHIAYNIFPENNLQRVTIGITASRYTYSNDPSDANNNPLNLNFNKIAPEINIKFKKSEPRSPYNFNIRYRNITIIKETFFGNYITQPAIYKRDTITTNFNDLNFSFSKSDAITPYDINFNFQQGEKIMKTSLTANYSYNFKNKNKGIDVRLFAGTFVGTDAVHAGPYRYRLSGQTGSQDYLYDNIFLGRSETEGLLSSQFTNTDGGFKFYSPLGQSSTWIAALNIKSSLGNMKVPINLYADIGTADPASMSNESIVYDAGVCISLKKNFFEVYFPILISQNFIDYKKANDIKYPETIRFTLNLNLINPFSLIRNFSL
ncbi:MAG: M1 family aminopeptidase, partial [Bacteroidetes bacterium]|nr:M1 family aminopeptidase [Bacteroidota bacterium]